MMARSSVKAVRHNDLKVVRKEFCLVFQDADSKPTISRIPEALLAKLLSFLSMEAPRAAQLQTTFLI